MERNSPLGLLVFVGCDPRRDLPLHRRYPPRYPIENLERFMSPVFRANDDITTEKQDVLQWLDTAICRMELFCQTVVWRRPRARFNMAAYPFNWTEHYSMGTTPYWQAWQETEGVVR